MLQCPHCHREINRYRNPVPTVDIVIEVADTGKIVLIRRANPPHGWALPGGFVDYGESVEQAAVREALEETGLAVRIVHLLGVYSRMDRDPRQHTISTVFIATAAGEPVAGDDAADAQLVDEQNLPADIAFDHRDILKDYFTSRRG